MLSGEFSTIRVSDVIILRDNRVRRECTEASISELAESISEKGLLHPIAINRRDELVTGETRLRACILLGWDRIPFQYEDSLEEDELLELEVEENVRRNDLPWKDKCYALQRLHDMKKAKNPSWTLAETAKVSRYGVSSVSEMLDVAKELIAGNKMVEAAPKLSTARGIVSRKKQRAEADAIGDARASPVPLDEKPKEILIEDFNLWAETYDGKPFNLIHCDFPYGIDFQDSAQSSGARQGTYKDSEEVYFTLLNTLIENRTALMGESAHLIFWFSMNFYQRTLDRLSENFRVDPYPLIWYKSDNTGILPDYNRYPRRIYETAFLASIGDRKLVAPVGNVFAAPGAHTVASKVVGHSSEKNEVMLSHFFRMVVDENTRMLDPTAGSGSALRAAKKMRAASVLGLEVNEEFARDAQRALDAI